MNITSFLFKPLLLNQLLLVVTNVTFKILNLCFTLKNLQNFCELDFFKINENLFGFRKFQDLIPNVL